MTLGGQYETLAGLPPSEKDYRQLVSDETMMACKLISADQTLALRRTRANQPVACMMETIPEVEVAVGDGDEQEDETEVTLVRKRRAPKAARDPDLDQAQSGRPK